MKRFGLCLAMFLGVGCGGDLCAAAISDVAGTWEFAFSDGGDAETITVEISDDGTVDVSTNEGAAIECELEQDDLCDLEVVCTDSEGGSVSFSIKKVD